MTSQKYLPTLVLLFSAVIVRGQDAQHTAATSLSANPAYFSELMTKALFVTVGVVFIFSLWVIFKANTFMVKRLISLEAEKQGVSLPETLVKSEPEGDDFWTRMRKKYWENPVPQAQEGDILLHHDYDGIRELDNHLPPWWVNMFIICVLWSIGYMWYYHWGGNGPDQVQEYAMEVETAKKEIAMALAGKANAVDESNVTTLTETAALGQGELIYKNNCTACHGQHGEGIVGPNFTDEYWLHGGGIKNVFKTIKYGVPEKGMIAWSAQLKPADIQKVASYILTLQGTNPPNPKAAQGDIWKEEAVAQDTTGIGSASH